MSSPNRRRIIAVYSIKNEATGHLYVGSTCDFVRRRGNHLFSLRRNEHHSEKLQKSWNDHGERSFSFYVLEVVADAKDLMPREQHYLTLLKPELNISQFAENTKGTSRSELSKRRMKEAAAVRPNNTPRGESAHDSKAILQYDMNDNFIQRFGSMKDAQRAGFGFVNKFSACCKGKIKYYKGYKYKYETEVMEPAGEMAEVSKKQMLQMFAKKKAA